MKIIVDKMPTEPKECLFVVPKMKEEKKKIICVRGCSIDNTLCSLKCGVGCNKLKEIDNG